MRHRFGEPMRAGTGGAEYEKMSNKNMQDELPIDWYLRGQEKSSRKKTVPNTPASELMKAVAVKAPVKAKIKRDFSQKEQKEINQRIKKAKEQKSEKSAENSPEAIERRKTIVAIKKKAKEMEKGNKSTIILFPSYSRNSDKLEWYKMGDFSAMYYVYRMAARMGRIAKLQKDTDKFWRMDYIASIRGVEKFLELAEKLNVFDGHEKTIDGFYLLHLKTPLTDEEVGILRRTESMRKERMHNVLRPKRADTGIYQAILAIDRQVLPKVCNMAKSYYVTVGDTMAKSIHALTAVYFMFADGRMEASIMRDELLNHVAYLMAGAALLGEVEAWGVDTATAVGENLNELKKMILEMK